MEGCWVFGGCKRLANEPDTKKPIQEQSWADVQLRCEGQERINYVTISQETHKAGKRYNQQHVEGIG